MGSGRRVRALEYPTKTILMRGWNACKRFLSNRLSLLLYHFLLFLLHILIHSLEKEEDWEGEGKKVALTQTSGVLEKMRRPTLQGIWYPSQDPRRLGSVQHGAPEPSLGRPLFPGSF